MTELRQDDHQRYDRQVPDDQHAEHHATGQGPDSALRLQGLECDHRARQRNQGAKPQRRLPGPAERFREREAKRDGQNDLQRAAGDSDRANGRELSERRLETKREQQQRDANFRELLDPLDVSNGESAWNGPTITPATM
jgi:hypothetical protein